MADGSGKPQIHFEQKIMLNNKVVTKAVFTGTCVPATGGRPFLPEAIKEKLKDAPILNA
jgi:acyl-CoA thioester hydrolase